MKNAGIATYSILKNDSDVNSAVGGRIFNERVLQGTQPPFICFHTSMIPVNADMGNVQTVVGTVQVNVYATDTDTAQDIAEYVRLAMQVDPLSVHNGVTVQSVLMDAQFSQTDDRAYEEGLFCEILSFTIYLGV